MAVQIVGTGALAALLGACGPGPVPTLPPATASSPAVSMRVSPGNASAAPSFAVSATPLPSVAGAPSPSPLPSSSPRVSAEGPATYATTTAFWDAGHGLVGLAPASVTSSGGEVDLTIDGGRTFWPVEFTRNAVSEITVAGSGAAWVLAPCAGEVAGCQPLLAITQDGGQSWDERGTDLTWVSFVNPLDGWGVIGGSVSSDPGTSRLERTRDGGATWYVVPDPCRREIGWPLRTVAFRDAAHGLLVCALTAGAGGELHAVFATDDAGRHWSLRSSTGGPATTDKSVGSLPYGGYITGVRYTHDGTAWLSGDRMSVETSRDGGVTWQALPIGGDGEAAVDPWPLDRQLGFAVTANPTHDGTELETTSDGGRAWSVRHAFPARRPEPTPPSPLDRFTGDLSMDTTGTPAWTGDAVPIRVTTDPTGGGSEIDVAWADVDFGDGTSQRLQAGCRVAVETSHVYRQAGIFTAHVTAASGCDPAKPVDPTAASMLIRVYPAASGAQRAWPACRPAQTALSSPGSRLAMGNASTLVVLRNTGRAGCTLIGIPRVALLDSSGRRRPTHESSAAGGSYLSPGVKPHLVALGPGGAAAFEVAWTDNPLPTDQLYDAACPVSRNMLVQLPGSSAAIRAAVDMAPCGGRIAVSAIVPGSGPITFN